MARNQTNTRNEKREPVAPSLIAYHVADRGKKGFWTRIGAAWDHKDGEGYTLQLDLVPADGGRIVLRPLKDEDAGDSQGEADNDSKAQDEEASA